MPYGTLDFQPGHPFGCGRPILGSTDRYRNGIVCSDPGQSFAYNRYSAQLESVVNRFDAFSDEFSGILSRAIHARERKAKA
jgi:Biopolymer transport proteins